MIFHLKLLLQFSLKKLYLWRIQNDAIFDSFLYILSLKLKRLERNMSFVSL